MQKEAVLLICIRSLARYANSKSQVDQKQKTPRIKKSRSKNLAFEHIMSIHPSHLSTRNRNLPHPPITSTPFPTSRSIIPNPIPKSLPHKPSPPPRFLHTPTSSIENRFRTFESLKNVGSDFDNFQWFSDGFEDRTLRTEEGT